MVSCTFKGKETELDLIPFPVEVSQQNGSYILPRGVFVMDASTVDEPLKNILNQQLKGVSLIEGENVNLQLIYDSTIIEEGYVLNVNDEGVVIRASGNAGYFYSIQTLNQLIKVGIDGSAKLPIVEINDYPRFKWRGMHLDVSRHFFSVNEVKQFLDYMATNKLNTFHWHLVDDQGWRLEIKKYPKLTEVGAWRKSIGFTSNQEKGLNMSNTEPYGGFYTQDQIKDIVAYAAERNITVVPEIELPGHSAAALVAYPEYYCSNAGTLEIWDQAGVSAGVYCVGKEEVFSFLQDVLDETMMLFPSTFIHIGGDETPKDTWLACPDCQLRMKETGSHDEHELQSYFISRIEQYLNRNGRRLIGWDEILDGGLAANAAVMSWRGVSGGCAAAEAGHDVVMTPMFPYYFNHTQNNLSSSPGHPGIRTLRDVYTFPVIPENLSESNRKHIIGVQANMWSEYMPDFKHIQYNLFPRIFAIAEVGWSTETKEWDHFYKRVEAKLPELKDIGINAGDISYNVRIDVKPDYAKQSALIEFITERSNPVYYTTDGMDPSPKSNLYKGAFEVNTNVHIKACQYKPDGSFTSISTKEIIFHKAFGKPYQLKYNHAPQYDGGGQNGLTNGFLGVMIGVEEKPIEAIIDLGEITDVSKINSRYKNQPMSWVFGPTQINYQVSEDGINFKDVAQFNPVVSQNDVDEMLEYPCTFDTLKARFIKVEAKGVGVCPEWHPAAGGKAWLFSDEIIVE